MYVDATSLTQSCVIQAFYSTNCDDHQQDSKSLNSRVSSATSTLHQATEALLSEIVPQALAIVQDVGTSTAEVLQTYIQHHTGSGDSLDAGDSLTGRLNDGTMKKVPKRFKRSIFLYD